jgi:prevent-host-death family protein
VKGNRKTEWPASEDKSLLLEEAVTLSDVGLAIPVRAEKAKLSALLELVAAGQVVTITSNVQPKAVLSPADEKRGRNVFNGMGDFLLQQSVHCGPSSEELVREDRDSRGS